MLSLSALSLLTLAASAAKEKHGLVIIDLQYDFGDPSGSLSVFYSGDDADSNTYLDISSSAYTDRVNAYLEENVDDFDFVVYSIDYHPSDHCSFAETMNDLGADFSVFDAINTSASAYDNESWVDDICESQTGFQVLWPVHCVRGTSGARFMDNIYDIRPDEDDLQRILVWRDADQDEEYTTTYELSESSIIMENTSYHDDLDHVQSAQNKTLQADVSHVFYVFKGRDVDVDSYSVLLGNDGATPTGLEDALLAYDYSPDNTDLTVFGIAYDYCVGFTVYDAVDLGYEVTLMDQLTAPVYDSAVPYLIEDFEALGVTIDYSTEWGMSTTAIDEDESNDDDDDGEVWMILFIVMVVIVVVLIVIVAMQCMKKDQGMRTAGGANHTSAVESQEAI